jgi:hypothetical protein
MQNRLKNPKNRSKTPQNAYPAFPEPKIDTLGGCAGPAPNTEDALDRNLAPENLAPDARPKSREKSPENAENCAEASRSPLPPPLPLPVPLPPPVPPRLPLPPREPLPLPLPLPATLPVAVAVAMAVDLREEKVRPRTEAEKECGFSLLEGCFFYFIFSIFIKFLIFFD